MTVRNALITGGSAGLGRALALALVEAGWTITIDGRQGDRLHRTGEDLVSRSAADRVVTVSGDIAHADHRAALVTAAARRGPVGLVVNNASDLGRSPLPRLRELDPVTFRRIWEVNVAAPLHLLQEVWPHLAEDAVIVNVSSDAAVEHYEGWGGYGSSKAALDHLTLTLAVEEQAICYAVDPGDMRTAMHQAAFPGEDISDRPDPTEVAPRLLALVGSGLPSGRYRLADLATESPEGSR